MGVRTIGTGGDYSTLAAWENDIGIGDPEGPWIGQCLAQTHDLTTILSIATGATLSPENYIRLTCAPDAYHRGVAADTGLKESVHAVIRKVGGNAVLSVIGISAISKYCEIDHLEIISDIAQASGDFIAVANGMDNADSHVKLHHLLIHHNGASSNSGNDGIVVQGLARVSIYRNIIYGLGGRAINLSSAVGEGCVIHNNTVFANNRSASSVNVQFTLPNVAYSAHNNLGFDPGHPTARIFPSMDPLPPLGSSKGGNASDYQSIPFELTFEEYTNLVAADHLRNPTTTWTATDCRLLPSSSMRDAGTTLSSDYGEGVRGNQTSSLPWDVGADELPYPYHLNGYRGSLSRGLTGGLSS